MLSKSLPISLPNIRFTLPVKGGVINHHFNEPRSYPNAPKRKQLHEGVDIVISDTSKVPVMASRKGKVHFKSYDAKGYGNYVILKHSDRFYTLYGHLESISVSDNQDVEIYDVLGIMGSTGNSTGKHLHFNIQDLVHGLDNYVWRKVIDPEPLLVSHIDSCETSILCYNILRTTKLIGE